MIKPVRSLRNWLEDIVAWGKRLDGYLDGMSEDDFLNDRRTQDAAVRCLECIGEASRQVLAIKSSEVPDGIELLEAYWARNRFAHAYFDLDMSRVWITATESAPRLVADVRQLLADLS